jgi:hypothetical protein
MITGDYFWPGLDKDVKTYIKSCESCARNKPSTHAPRGLLHSMPIPRGRFVKVAMDFVGPIPKCKGYNTILSITDRFMGYVRLVAVHSTDTAQQIAETFYLNWCHTFGLPEAITCDCDKLFTSHFWTELLRKLRIQWRMSTAAHLETDGASE